MPGLHILPNGTHIAYGIGAQPDPEVSAAAPSGSTDDSQADVILAFWYDLGCKVGIEKVEAVRAFAGWYQAPPWRLTLLDGQKGETIDGAVQRPVDGLTIVQLIVRHACRSAEVHPAMLPIGDDVMLLDGYAHVPGELFQLFVGGYHRALSGMSL